MMHRENLPLLYKDSNPGLSLLFATLCIVDIFGVFPIIALPRAIVQCGLLGIPLVLVVFGLQIYTAALLGKSWTIASSIDPQISRKNRYPLAAVTELTLGPRARTCVMILLDLTVFGCGIPNLLVASQNLQIFGQKISGNAFDLSFCYWLLLVGILLCPLMWLGSPRDMKWLALFSCVAVTLTAFLIWWCIIMDDRALMNDEHVAVPTSPTWDKFISGYGMLAFLFDVHPTLMTVQVDMRQPRDIDKAVLLSFLISGSLFGVTAGLAVWRYGGSTTANILQAVGSGYVIRAAILIAALQLCFSSVIGHSALFQHLEDQLHVHRSFGWKRCAMRSALVFFGVAIGESVPRFDIVMALIGGTLTGPLVFVLPPLIYARVRALQSDILARRKHYLDDDGTAVVTSASTPSESITFTSDPRVHSQSVYYGFIDDDDAATHRYSYIYYDEEDRLDEGDEIGGDEPQSGILIEDQDLETAPRFAPPKIIQRSLSTNSRRSRRQHHRRPDHKLISTSGIYDCLIDWFGYCIVALGLLITISSTYINVKNTIRFVNFTPPCIINATLASITLS